MGRAVCFVPFRLGCFCGAQAASGTPPVLAPVSMSRAKQLGRAGAQRARDKAGSRQMPPERRAVHRAPARGEAGGHQLAAVRV